MRIKDYIRYISQPFRLHPPSPGVYIFTYHQAANAFDMNDHFRGTFTDTNSLIHHFKTIKRYFKLISLRDYEKVINGKLTDPYAIITIDDGDASCEYTFLPVLKSLNIPATFFVNSAYLDGQDVSWPYALRAISTENMSGLNELQNKGITLEKMRLTDSVEYYQQGKIEISNIMKKQNKKNVYVGLNFLMSLDPQQFCVGLHGHEHDRYSLLSKCEQMTDLDLNIKILSKIPSFINAFAIPFGKSIDWNNVTKSICIEKKCVILTSEGGYNSHHSSVLSRIPADNRSINTIIAKLL